MIAGFVRCAGLFVLTIPVVLLGLPAVWIALRHTSADADSRQTFTQYPQHGEWARVRLPRWALLWDNPFDGMWGDKRGWWWNFCVNVLGRPGSDRVSMWLWAAIRNPANYFKRVACGIDVSRVVVSVARQWGAPERAPYRGGYLLTAVDQSGKIYPRLYAEYALFGSRGLMIDIGWKIKMSHNGTSRDAEEKDRIKGLVFVVSLAKDLK